MVKLVFWNYDYLHLNTIAYNYEIVDLTMSLKEILIRVRNELTPNIGTIIKIMKVKKSNPKELIDEEHPFWDSTTKIIDYIKYYNLENLQVVDLIFRLSY